MQTGVASRAAGEGESKRARAGATSSPHSESLKIAFIYRGDPRHRTANRLSMLKNVAAAKRLGHEVSLVVPREGMTAAEAESALASALEDFDISEGFPVVRVPRATVRGRGRRGFDFLSAAWARARGFDLVWSREFHAADFASAFGLPTVFEHHHPFNERRLLNALFRRYERSLLGARASDCKRICVVCRPA